jgi:membrane-bound inhibitor of C-type lysozyme
LFMVALNTTKQPNQIPTDFIIIHNYFFTISNYTLSYQCNESTHTVAQLALLYLNVALYTMDVQFVILNNVYSLFGYK